MPSLRIIYDNAADRAVLTASATATNLGPSNLQVNTKSKVCRSTGKTLAITAVWTAAETIGGIALPFNNFSPTTTVQIQAYTNSADSTPFLDTTASCLAGTPYMTGGGGVNTFAYGGGGYARIWLATQVVAKKLVITITDTNQTGTYIEVSRLVCGAYWEPVLNAEQGATMTVIDTSKHSRTEGGDQITDRGTRYRKQTLSLGCLNSVDRARMWDILWSNGMTLPLFLSLYPNNADSKLEQTHQIYGKLTVAPVMGTPYFNTMSASIDIEEV